ncbi:uncharacterized protein YALI1_B01889g [Yarrowia lipolytica]|uniref:Uncharacterized protein n=1 Tax=Yarrowia lipolytica TaxID=4952 RepID=A0A1D8N600_YARLL|nr:hypothetical protein YALI1_B01889g [Yarrowia lipolytica]
MYRYSSQEFKSMGVPQTFPKGLREFQGVIDRYHPSVLAWKVGVTDRGVGPTHLISNRLLIDFPDVQKDERSEDEDDDDEDDDEMRTKMRTTTTR